ncbi:gliding motility-associated ABC transporter substrate-binding protein GldG [Flavobacterium sp. NRK1]|uniref:gliding motility-associated ABC transporter substrate-binding protein GldG n=1 Tax=Flavobacterium sp. NRK1 TaxID=2954929 RepID=UPI002092FB82|nr:gliding motility-associated ABC transporter substrate-binding protein GldG [Flavobacterium sp. NRK1]MCO6149414.1 gliding motility-associated ABC transporter substrate-binding protein GldG [Flavobacterium sp. NRK1]
MEKMADKNANLKQLVITVIILLAFNFAGNYFFRRYDLTNDKRYTLSETTINTLQNLKDPIYIDVFLGGNDLPPEFKRLKDETRQILEEYKSRSQNIIYNFIDPLEDEENAEKYIQELYAMGFNPTNINSVKQGKKSLVQIFPWALANVGQKSVRVPLLVNNFGVSADENINKSVQLLEYAFTDAITKLTVDKKKNIAILKGNNEIADKYSADFLLSLKEYYNILDFNLDSLQNDRQKTLENLKRCDLAIIAKPTQPFDEKEKYVFDQYIMNGGKCLWLIDKVAIDLDSLRNETRSTLAYPQDLNLDDMFFKYGVRINYKLIQDLLSTPVSVQSPNGETAIDWLYSPIVKSEENHIINKNINLVKLEFANQIDTLKNKIKKTVLLKSSPQSKVVGTPVEIGLFQFMDKLNESEFNNTTGNQIIGVLLEGKFTSAYKNRVKPFTLKNNIDDGKSGKMIIIADGDIINYTYVNKKPLSGGIDQWTQQAYSNKEFLLNCVNYLLDENGLINIRGKNVELQFLDKKKVADNYTIAQFITVGLPILILALFGLLFTYIRKRQYSK